MPDELVTKEMIQTALDGLLSMFGVGPGGALNDITAWPAAVFHDALLGVVRGLSTALADYWTTVHALHVPNLGEVEGCPICASIRGDEVPTLMLRATWAAS